MWERSFTYLLRGVRSLSRHKIHPTLKCKGPKPLMLGMPLLPLLGILTHTCKGCNGWALYQWQRDHIHDLGNGWQFHLHHKVDAEGWTLLNCPPWMRGATIFHPQMQQCYLLSSLYILGKGHLWSCSIFIFKNSVHFSSSSTNLIKFVICSYQDISGSFFVLVRVVRVEIWCNSFVLFSKGC